MTPSILGVFKRVTRCATRPIPVTVRTRWLTIGEGGMLSPPPSTAHVLERASARIDGPAILHQLQSNRRACGTLRSGLYCAKISEARPFETGA